MHLSDHENADLDTINDKNSDYISNVSVFDNQSSYQLHTSTCTDVRCVFLATVYAIVCILSITGNGLVIWIAGFKLKKSIKCMWYISLAVSDFLCGAILPFLIILKVTKNWNLGEFVLSFTIFILILNMYSSVFLLVIISIDRCVVVIFPVWAQNNRTVKKCSVVIMFAWILATAFTIYLTKAPEIWRNEIKFVFGMAIPVLIIICCYIAIMLKLGANRMTMSTKPFKIMTLLIVMFITCWLPYHIIYFVKLTYKYFHIVVTIREFSFLLAFSNSCMNPLLYAFMAKDFRKQFNSIVLGRDETEGTE